MRPLLEAWQEVVFDFCRADRHVDNPFWYNERASLSTLAGAAWRLPDWTALEEFSTTKRGRVPHRKVDAGNIVRGRCDLLVANRRTSFGIEAKQAWQSFGDRPSKNHIGTMMTAAKRDAGNLTADEANHRLGLVFTAPYVPVSEVSDPGRRGNPRVIPSRVRQKFDGWVERADLGQYDAYAYVFIGRCANLVGDHAIKRVFPAALITITRCRTGTRASR